MQAILDAFLAPLFSFGENELFGLFRLSKEGRIDEWNHGPFGIHCQ